MIYNCNLESKLIKKEGAALIHNIQKKVYRRTIVYLSQQKTSGGTSFSGLFYEQCGLGLISRLPNLYLNTPSSEGVLAGGEMGCPAVVVNSLFAVRILNN